MDIGRFRRSDLQPVVGIDFGSSSLKAVVVSGSKAQPEIAEVAEIALPKGLLIEHQIQDIEQLARVVGALRQRILTRQRQVATAVAGSHVINKTFTLDSPLKEPMLGERVLVEVSQIISSPLDEISIDYEIVPNTKSNQVQVLFSAARTESINGYVETLREAGLEAVIVDVAAHALARAVTACYPELVDMSHAVAMVDIGATSLTFAVLVRGEVVYTRELSFGGDNFNQLLITNFGVDSQLVEECKRMGDYPEGYQEEVLAPWLQNLVAHLKRNIQLFCSSSEWRELPIMILSGGGSLHPGVIAALSEALNVEVRHPDPFQLLNPSTSIASHRHGAPFMVALGLALRSFTPCQR